MGSHWRQQQSPQNLKHHNKSKSAFSERIVSSVASSVCRGGQYGKNIMCFYFSTSYTWCARFKNEKLAQWCSWYPGQGCNGSRKHLRCWNTCPQMYIAGHLTHFYTHRKEGNICKANKTFVTVVTVESVSIINMLIKSIRFRYSVCWHNTSCYRYTTKSSSPIFVYFHHKTLRFVRPLPGGFS